MQTSYAGVMEASWQSDPFGNGMMNATVDVSLSHFTGQDRDTESGNDYFQSRYYASNSGRFLSPDDGSGQSVGDPQSLNLFSYVRNNPLSLVDPDGHKYVGDDPTQGDPSTPDGPGAAYAAICPAGLLCLIVDDVVAAAKDIWNWLTQPGSPGAPDNSSPDMSFLTQSLAYHGQQNQRSQIVLFSTPDGPKPVWNADNGTWDVTWHPATIQNGKIQLIKINKYTGKSYPPNEKSYDIVLMEDFGNGRWTFEGENPGTAVDT